MYLRNIQLWKEDQPKPAFSARNNKSTHEEDDDDENATQAENEKWKRWLVLEWDLPFSGLIE